MAELEYKDMSNNTPEALRLARMIEHYNSGVGSQRIVEDYQQAAAELRRLHDENEKLCATLAEQPAEPDAEPVAWIDITDEGQIVSSPRMYSDESREERPLYTAPKPRRRLTDEEIDNTTRKQVDDLLDHIYEYGTATEGIDYRVRAIARAIERAHGIGEQE